MWAPLDPEPSSPVMVALLTATEVPLVVTMVLSVVMVVVFWFVCFVVDATKSALEQFDEQLFVNHRSGSLHRAVPPTVNPSIRKVGNPTPTGTLWPFLPQVPSP